MLIPEAEAELLTRRQRQTWALLAHGANYAEIGHQLGISRHTVRNYQRALADKLGTGRSAELAALYFGATPLADMTPDQRQELVGKCS